MTHITRSVSVVALAVVLSACSTIDESHYTPAPSVPIGASASPSGGPSIYPVPSPRSPRPPKPSPIQTFAPSSPLPTSVATSPAASPSAAAFTKTVTQSAGRGKVVELKVTLKGQASAGTFRAQWSAGSTATTISGPGGAKVTANSTGVVHQRTATTEVFQVKSPDAGAWTMRTRVLKAPGGPVTVTLTYTSVPPGNDAPIARFTLKRKGKVVTVDASASKDPDGTISSWTWDWGDDATGSGKTTTHTYEPGTYAITLLVADAGGGMDTKTATVTVPAG